MSCAIYPLFILEEDDLSLRKVDSERELDWYERIDVEDGAYRGWDSHWRPFRLTWNQEAQKAESQFTGPPDWEGFKSMVKQVLMLAVPVDNFPPGYCNPSHLLKMLKEDQPSQTS